MHLYHSPAEQYTWLRRAVEGITNKWNISTGLGTRFPCAEAEKFNCYVYSFIKHLWTKQPCLVASTAPLAVNGLVPIVTWHFQLLFQSTEDLYGFGKRKEKKRSGNIPSGHRAWDRRKAQLHVLKDNMF